MSIVIVDYGMGNLGSVANMLKKAGHAAIVSSDPDTIRSADKLILPGVGAFDKGMESLAERNLIQVLGDCVLAARTPVLGLCLGMQLMSRKSEEGQMPGLGWLDAQTVRFSLERANGSWRIPHMGWNTIQLGSPHPLFADLDQDARFYFVHSYHLQCENDPDRLGLTDYVYPFVSAVARGNIMGVQFHPEKSHRFGLRLLKNFAEMPT